MTAYEFCNLIVIFFGGLLALLGFLRNQELNKDAAFSELYMHLSHDSPMVRAAAASRLPSFYRYKRLLFFRQPYTHQVLLLLLSALKEETEKREQETRNIRQTLVDALSSILGSRSLGEVISLLPSVHRGANLVGAILNELKLYEFRFDGTDCTDASFKRCDLGKANFVGCKLWKAKFDGAKLASANLTNAELWEANFANADLKHATIIVPSRCINEKKDTNFRNADLKGAVLSQNVADLCEEQGHNLQLLEIVPTPPE